MLFIVKQSAHYSHEYFVISISLICCCAALVFAIIRYRKPGLMGKILSGLAIPLHLLMVFFCLISFDETYMTLHGYTEENFFLDSGRKIYYSIGEGYFDYHLENDELTYRFMMGGDGGPGPYYDVLYPAKREPLLNIEAFLDYYAYDYSIYENMKVTAIHLKNDTIYLHWDSKTVTYTSSGKTIKLQSPVIRKTYNNPYHDTDTFVSVSFLKEARLLK